MPKPQRRSSSKEGRRFKKRVSPLNFEGLTYVDYKDTDLLSKFISDRAKIRTRAVSGNTIQQQKEVARAIKNAREMGLIAYTSRVTTQRRGKRDDRRDDRKRDDSESEAPTNEAAETVNEEAAVADAPVEATEAPAEVVEEVVAEEKPEATEAPAEETGE